MEETRTQNSLLTGPGGKGVSDREFLKTKDSVAHDHPRTKRSRIRTRVREGLRDFRLLAEHLDEDDRKSIFDAEPHTPEYHELEDDVMHTLRFLYVGMGGEHAFRGPLKRAVTQAEVDLNNVEYTHELEPRFTVDKRVRVDMRDVAREAEHGNWDALTPPQLFNFVRRARNIGAIDFDTIHEHYERPVGPDARTLEMDTSRSTTQRVSVDTLQRVEDFAEEGDTFDDVLNRLLNMVEEAE